MRFNGRQKIGHQVIHAVNRPLRQRDQAHGIFRNAPENEAVNFGCRPPVIGIAIQHDAVVLDPIDKSKRACAHGMPRKISPPFFDRRRTDNGAKIHRQIGQKRRVGPLQINRHSRIVYRTHIFHDLAHRHARPVLIRAFYLVKRVIGLELPRQ